MKRVFVPTSVLTLAIVVYSLPAFASDIKSPRPASRLQPEATAEAARQTAQAANATEAAAWGQATTQAVQATAQAQVTAYAQATADASATAEAQIAADAATAEARITVAVFTAEARRLQSTVQAAIVEQEQLITALDRMAVERERSLQYLILCGPWILLVTAAGSIIWAVRRLAAVPEIRSQVAEPAEDIIEGEFEDLDEQRPAALLPPVTSETAGARPQLIARSLPPVEKSPWSPEAIERLLIGEEL